MGEGAKVLYAPDLVVTEKEFAERHQVADSLNPSYTVEGKVEGPGVKQHTVLHNTQASQISCNTAQYHHTTDR